MYLCVAALDPDYGTKFAAIKSLLEQELSNAPGFPCKLEVIDSTPYSQSQDPSIPCTGIQREFNDPIKFGGDPSGAPTWSWEMPVFMTRALQLATEVDPHGRIVNAFRSAINIALCKEFSDSHGTSCTDGDMMD